MKVLVKIELIVESSTLEGAKNIVAGMDRGALKYAMDARPLPISLTEITDEYSNGSSGKWISSRK